jgi:hypothetical protein
MQPCMACGVSFNLCPSFNNTLLLNFDALHRFLHNIVLTSAKLHQENDTSPDRAYAPDCT